ncbi:MAG: hypothetical protein LC753_18145 [Acidobacteria bacterium]|nr:hypothetical protein [Acidobacteriota bacterium]MCA1652101.1 hypothetical protein [Acidobacteriota bacterium]
MLARSVPAVAVCLQLARAAAAQDAQPAAKPVQPARQRIEIVRVSEPPKLEDYLSSERRGGTRIEGFLQRNPGDLTPVSEATEAFLSHDETTLYAVFVCRTAKPSTIRARMARREAVFGDDFVGLFLDTFNDKQRSYMFIATPLGIQADGITTDG